MPPESYRKIASMPTVDDFIDYLRERNIDLPCERELGTQLALGQPYTLSKVGGESRTIGNRWAILPMEGWDANSDGTPSDLMRRRWIRFATSGAKVLFGCEACAVTPSGRSNTRQLFLSPHTAAPLAALRAEMVAAHNAAFGSADDLYVGLQLTHSGRFSHPNDDKVLEPVVAYRHPLLDQKFGTSNTEPLSDDAIDEMVEQFIAAGRLAFEAGFDFVDVKLAHGYFGHELLSAVHRDGKYGGSLENRTRFFRDIVAGLRRVAPQLDVAVRLSLCDFAPFIKGSEGYGVPMVTVDYPYAFGGDGTGRGWDLTETFALLELFVQSGVTMVGATVGSPYYNPHIQRPAFAPVFDGYAMPEDPLRQVAKHVAVVAACQRRFPTLPIVGSGYSYLQDYLPNVAEAVVAAGDAAFVGVGRMALSYPEMCGDVLAGRPLDRKRICRTLGDCTNAPRRGFVSGCYPLDTFYKSRSHPDMMPAR